MPGLVMDPSADPCSIAGMPRYKGERGKDVHALARRMDGAVTNGFNCSVPSDFPEGGEYVQRRQYQGADGKTYTKEYTLKGRFLETDELDRVMLTAYWKLVGNNSQRFQFVLADYLLFRGVDPHSGKNRDAFLDYLERTRANTWKMNFWYNYEKKKFQEMRQYGILEEFAWVKEEFRGTLERILVSVVWSSVYYDVFRHGANWKYFDLNRLVEIPEQSQLARKLLLFLANGNNEFMTEGSNGLLVYINLKILCEFFLAMHPAPVWRYKDRIRKPLETLRAMNLLSYEDVSRCFVKDGRETFLSVLYTPTVVSNQQRLKQIIRQLAH